MARRYDKILEMIAKADMDRLDFGLKKITKDHSHVVFTNETKYQNYQPDPDSKTNYLEKDVAQNRFKPVQPCFPKSKPEYGK